MTSNQINNQINDKMTDQTNDEVNYKMTDQTNNQINNQMKETSEETKHTSLITPPVMFQNGILSGPPVIRSVKYLSQLSGLFEDQEAFDQLDGKQTIYEVDVWLPVEPGTEGGLYFGLTHLYPGEVNREYFMTYGHFHSIENRAEYYWGIEGEGMLLLMDKDRNTRAEIMKPGSLHYIPGHTAHRVVNTGKDILRFGACWPSDAGHNYASIGTEGFSKRVKNIDHIPSLV